MTARIFFEPFEAVIRERFATAVAEAGDRARRLTLELHDEPHEAKPWRTEFSVTMPDGPVRITWAGIASLWCCSQGAVRLARRMFEGKRKGLQRLERPDDPEITNGLNLFVLCRRLRVNDFRPEHTRWMDWAPAPEIAPAGEDSQLGNQLFFGALGWIMRHEIAHVVLRHVIGVGSIQAENEADKQATEWYRGDRRADPTRELGARPAKPEIELEFRAIAMGFGLIWVAMFESLAGRASMTHPPTAERIFRCMDVLELREDSMAAEVLADALQAWIDPQGNWAPGGHADARAALDDALNRLYRLYDPRGEARRQLPAVSAS